MPAESSSGMKRTAAVHSSLLMTTRPTYAGADVPECAFGVCMADYIEVVEATIDLRHVGGCLPVYGRCGQPGFHLADLVFIKCALHVAG